MKKVAILFGNDKYDFSNAQLQCAVNDAEALQEKLDALSFETKSILNSDMKTMAMEIANFETTLPNYDVGLFFFAGHGFQFDGLNYLAATDTSFADDRSAAYTSFRLDDIIAAMNRSNILIKILIIDACRSSSVSGSRGIGTGFAPIFAPRGTIIAFATSPGQTAKERGEHGLFTAAILEHIMTKNITIENMFKRVRNTVYMWSNATQVTWEHTSLMGDFVFNKNKEEITKDIYCREALSDEVYECEVGSKIYDLICDLKTHDYNYQNPVVYKMNKKKTELLEADINDLFVLGRNLYQASVNAFKITNFFDSLHSNLSFFDKRVRRHLLDGMEYEIYFNSKAHLRKRFKTHKYEEVLSELLSNDGNDSRKFICSQLEDFEQKVFYVPGGQKIKITIALNEYFIEYGEEGTVYFIEGIYMERQNILYNEDGTELYQFSESGYYHRDMNVTELEAFLRENLVVTRRNILIEYTFDYEPKVDEITIVVPMNQQLLRYAN